MKRIGAACSIEGCEKRVNARGWCDNHYYRWRTHGDPLGGRAFTVAERFWEKVDRRGLDDCWEWLGSKDLNGYGAFRDHGVIVKAHRWAYEAEFGPIPDDLTVDHRCNNPSCVNTKHLRLATLHDNILRGNGSPARNARKTHCKRGHVFSVENTRVETSGSRRCRACARERYTPVTIGSRT